MEEQDQVHRVSNRPQRDGKWVSCSILGDFTIFFLTFGDDTSFATLAHATYA